MCLGERVHAGTMDHIAIDNVAAARTATSHLLERGRRRIAAIGAQVSPVAETARLRLAGYTEALTRSRSARSRRDGPAGAAAGTATKGCWQRSG